MLLKELIARLEKEDPDKLLKKGFHQSHSHRGDYAQLAFEPCGEASIADLLKVSKFALNQTYEGYKGGDFIMTGDSEVFIAMYSECGYELSSELLEYMIKDVVGKKCDGKECGGDLNYCKNPPKTTPIEVEVNIKDNLLKVLNQSQEVFGFELALILLKEGKKLYREEWGAQQLYYVYLIDNDIKLRHMVDDFEYKMVTLKPMLMFHDRDEMTHTMWLPDMASTLADDWRIMDNEG